MTLVNNPAADLDIFTGNARSCSAAGQMIFVGGRDSGQNCFDASGNRVYQDFCRLFCFANETLNSTHKQRLDQIVGEAANFFASTLRLQVWASENYTLNIVSSETNDCAGMSLNVATNSAVVIAVTTRPTRQLGGITAHSSACQLLEMNNRPILVHLNVDPVQVRPEGGLTDADLKEALVHQIMHGLGFNNKSYPLLRHPDDPTKSYFQYSPTTYPTGPISSSATSGFVNSGNGNFWMDQTKIAPGQKIFFKGPNTIKVAKEYFACGSATTNLPVDGVELENGGSSELTTGNHWEKRLFVSELLIGTKSWKMYFSAFSMAMLQDTGYFSVPKLVSVDNWTDVTAMNYGRSRGCNFLSQKCDKWPAQLSEQNSGSGENANYFCSDIQGNGCGFDRSYIGECNVVQFSADLPSVYQYFPSSAKKGGQDSLMDYCPIYRLMESGECSSAGNGKIFDRDITSGMVFGDSARCFISNVLNSSVISGGKTFGGCFQSFCHFSEQAGYVVVGRDAIKCAKDSEVVELFPPARFNVNKFVPQTGIDTLQFSYNYHGVIQCSSLYSECQAQRLRTKTYTSSPIKLANVTTVFPTITAVVPPWGDPTGGTPVTILGSALDRCSGAYVGGVPLSDFVILNNSAVRGKLGNVGSVFGGPGADGVGDALVEVKCRINEFPHCASGGGCILARANGVFNYSLVDPNAVPLSTGVFSDFFDSAAGKVVGVVMCVVVIVALIVVARLCFKDGLKVGSTYTSHLQPPQQVGMSPASSNRNLTAPTSPAVTSSYHAQPLVVDNINLDEDLFTPRVDDDSLPPPPPQHHSYSNNHNNANSDIIGDDQELEPVVVLI